MNARTTAGALVLLFLGALAPPAYAGDNGFYVGGSILMVSKDTPSTDYELFADAIYDVFSYTPTDERVSFDDSDVAYSLLIGYRFTRYFALEGGYARLGQLAYRAYTTGVYPADRGEINLSMDSETSGFMLAGLVLLPINYNWEIYGRAGVLIAENSFRLGIRARGDIFAQPSSTGSFARGTDELYAGVGVSVRFFDIYDVRLEYQRVFNAGLEITMNKGDLDVVNVGLIVTF